MEQDKPCINHTFLLRAIKVGSHSQAFTCLTSKTSQESCSKGVTLCLRGELTRVKQCRGSSREEQSTSLETHLAKPGHLITLQELTQARCDRLKQ